MDLNKLKLDVELCSVSFLARKIENMKIIYLTVVFLRWCYNDIKENFQDIKFRYWMETSKEAKDLIKDIEKL
jgi:prephenate dehydratase